MSEMQLLEKIASDLDFLKMKIVSIEETIVDIGNDLHPDLRPEYVDKVKKIMQQDSIEVGNVENLKNRLVL